MDQSVPPIRFNPNVSNELVLVSVTARRDALFQGIDRFLIDIYEHIDSSEARVANMRFETLVHSCPTNEL
jgi:hypothetical protein